MTMKLFLLAISIYFQCLHSLPAPHNLQKRSRNESAKMEFSKNVYGFGEDETTTNASNVLDICNSSSSGDSDNGRIRRYIRYSLTELTTTESTVVTTMDTSHLSSHFMHCKHHIFLEPGCYEKLHNESVFVPMYHMVFDRSDYIIRDDLFFFCPDFFVEYTEQDKFSDDIRIASLVCAIISTVCLILHIVMFILVSKLRNLPGYCLLSLCVALLGAYLCTFVQYEIDDITGCSVVGMFMLYFFLAAFFWMNTMMYDVWRSIRLATAKLMLTTDRPIMVRLARYSLYAWGIPLMIVISSIITHYSTSNIKYQLIFDISTCWFTYKQALTLYFAGPVFTLLGVNMLFFASSFYMISNASMNRSHPGSKDNSELWSRLCLSLRLGSVMGFMWIFGIIAEVTKQEWLMYLYAICSALQGVFIFFSFTMSERSRKFCLKSLKNRKCSVMPSQTSSQQMTSI